jgi:hypothetical protein
MKIPVRHPDRIVDVFMDMLRQPQIIEIKVHGVPVQDTKHNTLTILGRKR